MNRHLHLFDRIPLRALGIAFGFLGFISIPVCACTIFVLTDSTRALFFNNEDYSNPITRIWFVQAGAGYHGCVYVGFDNGYAQGGMNTKGLAFDWVAGFMEKWEPGPGLKSVRGNPSERMLETCTTVEEAIAFYRKYREPEFSRAKILVADRTGASVIIGAEDGKLQVEIAHHSRGFGYGGRTLEKMLAKAPEPTVANGRAILRACLQQGQNATKYSNIFDLKTGDIILFPAPEKEDHAELNLILELKKGAHYYDIPKIQQQVTRAPLPLLDNMKRFFLDELHPIPDRSPKVTRHFQAMIQDAFDGTMRPGDYSAELWKQLAPAQKEVQAELKKLGGLVSIALVESKSENGNRDYRYLVEFKKARVLQHFVLDSRNKVALIQSESAELKLEPR